MHHARDLLLQRAGDFIGRYGGEEFVVILPNADETLAGAQAERLCERVRELAIPHAKSGAAPIVTVSIGCAATIPVPASMPTTLLAATDHALYEAPAHRAQRAEVRHSSLGLAALTHPSSSGGTRS